MRRPAQFLPFVLLVPTITADAQVSLAAQQISPVSAAPGVTFDVLSDTGGTQLNSYLGTLAPELQRVFLGHLSAAEKSAHQQVDLLLTIDSEGKLSALRLAPGTQDSPVAKAAWLAARDLKYAALPNSLGAAGLRLRVHLLIA